MVLASGAVASEGPLVARWRGGELTLARFHEIYDPHGTALLAGGERLRSEVAKAVFREIEGARGLALGLDRDPALEAELAAWRTRHLAGLARAKLGLGTRPEPEEVALAWSARWREILPPATEVDLEVLFVRCALRASARLACEERLRNLLARLAQGEAFAAIALEEKALSGAANGSFPGVALGSLMIDLATAAATLPVQELSGPIASPAGLFAVRVLRRGERPAPELSAVEPLVRQFLLAERERPPIAGLPAPAGEEDTPENRLAAFAVASGLDRSATFRAEQERQQGWLLADAAFLRDPEQAPRPETIQAAIRAEPERWRRAHLELAVVDATGGPEARRRALVTAALLADRLSEPTTAERFFAGSPVSEPAVTRRTLAAVDPATLDPLLAETVAKLAPGSWGGPVPVARLDGMKDERKRQVSGAGYEGLAWVRLHSWAPAEETAVALAWRRATRAQMSASAAAFMDLFGKARGVELLVP
jgi:hypothetical protein